MHEEIQSIGFFESDLNYCYTQYDMETIQKNALRRN